jgi:hypothetical protein
MRPAKGLPPLEIPAGAELRLSHFSARCRDACRPAPPATTEAW